MDISKTNELQNEAFNVSTIICFYIFVVQFHEPMFMQNSYRHFWIPYVHFNMNKNLSFGCHAIHVIHDQLSVH
jgi:hypothetical protein